MMVQKTSQQRLQDKVDLNLYAKNKQSYLLRTSQPDLKYIVKELRMFEKIGELEKIVERRLDDVRFYNITLNEDQIF